MSGNPSSRREGKRNDTDNGSEQHEYAYPEFPLDSSAEGYEPSLHPRSSDVRVSSDYTPFRTSSATSPSPLPTPPSTPPPARRALPLRPMGSSTAVQEGVEHVHAVPDDPGLVTKQDLRSRPKCGEVPKRWWVAAGAVILVLFAVAFGVGVAVHFATRKGTTYHDTSEASSSSTTSTSMTTSTTKTSTTHPDFNLTSTIGSTTSSSSATSPIIVQTGTTICYPQKILASWSSLPSYNSNCTDNNCCLEQTGDARLELAQGTDIHFKPFWSNQFPRLIQKAGARLVVRSATPSRPQDSQLRFDSVVLTQEENSTLTFEFLLHSTRRRILDLPRVMDVAGDALVQIVLKGSYNWLSIGAWDHYSHLRMTGASTLIVGGRMKNFRILTSSGSVHIGGGTLKLTDVYEKDGPYRYFLVKSSLVVGAGATLEVLVVDCCVVTSPTRILAGQKVSIYTTGVFGGIDCRHSYNNGTCTRP